MGGCMLTVAWIPHSEWLVGIVPLKHEHHVAIRHGASKATISFG